MTELPDAADGARPPLHYRGPARLVSLLMAGGVSLLLTLYPQAVIQAGAAPRHTALTLTMWGVAAGFVHGVGFVPRNGLLRVLLGPLAAWSLMPCGMLFLAKF
ncbi:MAG: cyd operon YbgE family protein [Gammaproteobacteria bacterium]